MTYSDVLNTLKSYSGAMNLAEAYTLHRIKKFMQQLGNPQENYQVLHVAGTSGKTSTCTYISHLLQTEGKKVGLSISPHMVDVRERTQINNQLLSKDQYAAYFSEFYQHVDSFSEKLSYFELLVAFSYWVFDKEQVDVAVIETGLGGLLDATNVIANPNKISVITPIGLDHTHILGTTIDQISANKAGIIQPGNKVYVAQQPGAIATYFVEYAENNGAIAQVVQSSGTNYLERNAELAAYVVGELLGRQVSADAALLHQVPGRFEVHSHKNRTYIFDGAHNAQKMEALVEMINQRFPGAEIALIFSLLNTKRESLSQMVASLSTLNLDVVCIAPIDDVQDSHHTSLPDGVIANEFQKRGVKVSVAHSASQAATVMSNTAATVILVTGSLYPLQNLKEALTNPDAGQALDADD